MAQKVRKGKKKLQIELRTKLLIFAIEKEVIEISPENISLVFGLSETHAAKYINHAREVQLNKEF